MRISGLRLMLLAPAIVAASFNTKANEASRPSPDLIGEGTKEAVIVGFEWVDIEPDRILLIRSGGARCAVRFVEVNVERIGQAGVLQTISVKSHAVAEVFVPSASPASGSERGRFSRDTLSFDGMAGIGRLAVHRGDTAFSCDGVSVRWIPPSGVMFRRRNSRVEVAPTAWRSFDQVDWADPRLEWHALDESSTRPMRRIPYVNLPGH